jgi:uncharacterized protein YecE (DUF72 family)
VSKSQSQIRVGTSGWHYDHWAGRFYPTELKKGDWLSFYMRHFDTVEINNTFYHLPKETSIERWHRQAPKSFIYTVKANRYITHIKRLKDTREEVKRFFERIKPLGANLGPVLYQLPPGLHKDTKLLADFISLLPKKRSGVFEFRNDTWYCDEVYELLDEHGLGFCAHDMPGKPSPKIITGELVYVRFHGTTGRYSGNYPAKALKTWAKWIIENAKPSSRQVYAYFNNDYNAYAVNNARELCEMLVSR